MTTKKLISIVLVVFTLLNILSFSVFATNTVSYTIKSPYETVDWDTWNQYQAQLHTHTLYSDGTVDVKDVDEKTLEEVEVEEEKDEDLNKKVSDLEDELAVLRNDFLLAHANLENTKKRLSNDFAKRSKYLASDFALSLLPAIDNMEKVLSETDDKDNPLYEAVDMMYRQLQTSLKLEGDKEIEALGEKFDPNFHHAVMMEECEDCESDIVIEELQKGYTIKDRVLRAAMVKVSK